MAAPADLASGDRTGCGGGVAGARPASVAGAEGVGADARVNNYALLTDSLKKRDSNAKKSWRPRARFPFQEPFSPPPPGTGPSEVGSCFADFHSPYNVPAPRTLRGTRRDSAHASSSRVPPSLNFISQPGT